MFSQNDCIACFRHGQGETHDFLNLLDIAFIVCCERLRLSFCFACAIVCIGFSIKFLEIDSYLSARALSNSAPDSLTDAASFFSGSFVVIL